MPTNPDTVSTEADKSLPGLSASVQGQGRSVDHQESTDAFGSVEDNRFSGAADNHRSPVASGVRIALAVLGFLAVLWLAVQLRGIIVLLLISIVLATGIYPLIERMHTWRFPPKGWRLPRWLVIFSVLLIIVIIASGLFYFLGSIFWKEATQAWGDLPSYTNHVSRWLDDLRKQFPQIPSEQSLLTAVKEQAGKAGQYVWQTTSMVMGLLGGIGSALTVLVLTFYMLLEREKLRSAFRSFIPPDHQESVVKATEEALLTMGGWLRGQFILVAAVTTIISLTMAALGLPHPFLIGIVGGVGEFIPMVGPIAGGFIAVPMAFAFMPLWVGIVTLVFFILLSVIESNVIVPKVMEKNVGLSPFTTIVAVLAGVSLAGPVGALLALPLTAALRVYLRRLVIPTIQKQ